MTRLSVIFLGYSLTSLLIRKDFAHFLQMAFASGAELETQLEISEYLELGKKRHKEKARGLLEGVMKMLNVILKKVKER